MWMKNLGKRSFKSIKQTATYYKTFGDLFFNNFETISIIFNTFPELT